MPTAWFGVMPFVRGRHRGPKAPAWGGATARSAARRLGGAALPLLAAGCSNTSVTTYDVAQRVGNPGWPPVEATEGRIVTSRVVAIAEEPDEAAPLIGATFGGVLGPLGSLVGGGIGTLVAWLMRGGEGIEYLVAMDDGRTVTLVEEREDSERPLAAGTPVLVAMGALSSRVIPQRDEERDEERDGNGTGDADDWVNPDAPPTDATPAAPPLPEADDPLQPRRR